MELRHLRYFVTLAERLHFLSAADELGITQPALSSSLRALEDELGVVLVDRSRKKHVQLTPSGEVFLRDARQTLRASQRAKHNAIAVNEGMSGLISVGHTDDFATDIIPSLMLEYNKIRSGVILNFHQGISFHLPDLLRQGEVDCLLETVPLPQPMANYATMPLKPTPIVLVAPTCHHLSQHETVSIAQIMAEESLYLPTTRRSAFVLAIERLLGPSEPDHHANIGPTSTTLQIELVRRTGRLSLSTVGTFPQTIDGIATIPIKHPGAQLSRVLVWRKDNPNPALPHFVDYLRNTWSINTNSPAENALT